MDANPQQAAESLCMNGRALNEKAIEVSPSSSRVLDRAADILTPFPPSKNRPRPGDWTCPSCGFSNFQRRTACFRCSYPLSQGMAPTDPMGYPYGYGPPMMQHGPHMGNHGHGGHGGHGHGHGGGHGRGAMHSLGASAPFRPGDWKCGQETCNYHNFAKNINCLRCGAPRANAAVVADANFNPMNDPSFGMGPQSMGGTPGPTPFGPGGFGNAGGFPGQQYGGPSSTYALPAGLAGGPNPYPPMGGQYAHNGSIPGSGFDSRAAEAAFSAAGPAPTTGGPSFNSNNNNNGGGYDGASDPFHFLNAEMNQLSMNNDARRNTGAGATKSPN
jgi:hypothetical protein